MKNLIFLFMLVSLGAYGQTFKGNLITQKNGRLTMQGDFEVVITQDSIKVRHFDTYQTIQVTKGEVVKSWRYLADIKEKVTGINNTGNWNVAETCMFIARKDGVLIYWQGECFF